METSRETHRCTMTWRGETGTCSTCRSTRESPVAACPLPRARPRRDRLSRTPRAAIVSVILCRTLASTWRHLHVAVLPLDRLASLGKSQQLPPYVSPSESTAGARRIGRVCIRITECVCRCVLVTSVLSTRLYISHHA